MLRWVFGLGLWGAVLLLWGQPPVELRVQPLLGESPAKNGAFPLAVQLESRTGNYQGVLRVSVSGFGSQREYQYPIDLPAGSRKVVIATPIVEEYTEAVAVRFVASGVNLEARQPIRNILETDQLAVLVGDAIGGLSVLEQVRTIQNHSQHNRSTGRGSESKYKVAYCRPELFPEQVIGLSGAQLIVLGAGAERLQAEHWRALRQWVLMGGVLIAPGGAGAVYLQNPLLRDLLPVEPQGTRTISQLSALRTWTGVRAPASPVIITQATLKSGDALLAQDGQPLVAVRPYGLGAVMFLAFNPMETPLREYDARARLWQKIADQTASFVPSYTLSAIHDYQSRSWDDPYEHPRVNIDMELKPPSVALVLALLGVYFVLVVPVSYLVLKRLRALDWAWVVTPVIALLFVGVLWQLAGNLYRKSLSSRVHTLIIAQAGYTDAYAVNSTLFFFPRAGLFDLQFDQSDMVEAGVQNERFSISGPTPTVRTVQGEPTRVEGYRVSNLSFQWFRYTRSLQLQGQLEGALRIERRNGRMFLSGQLRNRLPYPLTSVEIFTPYGSATVSDLPARRSTALNRQPLRPMHTPRPHDWDFRGDNTRAMAPEKMIGLLLAHREYKGVAFLMALASEPVLTPELSDAADHSAQVLYLVSIPLEGMR